MGCKSHFAGELPERGFNGRGKQQPVVFAGLDDARRFQGGHHVAALRRVEPAPKLVGRAQQAQREKGRVHQRLAAPVENSRNPATADRWRWRATAGKVNEMGADLALGGIVGAKFEPGRDAGQRAAKGFQRREVGPVPLPIMRGQRDFNCPSASAESTGPATRVRVCTANARSATPVWAQPASGSRAVAKSRQTLAVNLRTRSQFMDTGWECSAVWRREAIRDSSFGIRGARGRGGAGQKSESYWESP